MTSNYALIIIAKYPEGKSVKTRLRGFMTDRKRIELYRNLLENTLHKLRSIQGVDTFIAYAPLKAEKYFSQFGVRLIPLHKGDLGIRMYNSFSRIFFSGYQKAVLVGADIPALTQSIILKAFNLLSIYDIVFGPAKDGGYYLVGMNTPVKEIFDGVPWSSDQTLKTSMKKAEQGNFNVAFTKTLSDVDTFEDVKKAGLI